jgi:hypothetical protein
LKLTNQMSDEILTDLMSFVNAFPTDSEDEVVHFASMEAMSNLSICSVLDVVTLSSCVGS